ncbi:mediator-associated protein 2-like [Solanum pennellii]|uniref:Mediator-associated protein 2-like n=1 Tax=Solanum pennellii TaxID=28526 RepID=A0ABM1HJI9_SOLPN|nr:mediator-associated protein 2-like [Solanum pennellii]XP_027775256.1 mediator-associated protein 2-like [Solanum pennellii]
MDAPNELSYKPPSEFEEVKKDSLVNLNISDSTELWLIQWPFNQHPGLDGQEVSLKLHHDGHMGSFEDSSGKSYEVVSCRAQDPDAMVFLSSDSEPKIAGKISRRVSLVHYPEPSELKPNSINLKQMMAQRSSGTTLTNSSRRFATPSQSTRTRSIMRSGSSSKSTKRKHSDGGPAKSNNQSVQDSGKSGRSALTSSGSFDHSQDQKSKKKRKIDG